MPTAIAVLMILALAFIFRSADPTPESSATARRAASGLTAPGEALAEAATGWRSSRSADEAEAAAALESLRERVGRLESELALKEEELAGWRRGERLGRGGSTLDVPAHYVFLAADVIGRQPQPRRQSVRLNRGTRHGVRPEAPVVSDQGLIGIVREVEERACIVQLVSDPYFVVAAQVSGSEREGGPASGLGRGVAMGRGGGESLRMELETPSFELNDGARVVTSGLADSLYPRGLRIGTLRIGDTTSRGLEAIDVEPAADLETNFVLILLEW